MVVYNPRASRRTTYINACDAITASLAQSSFYHSLLFGPPEALFMCQDARGKVEESRSPEMGSSQHGSIFHKITKCVTLPQMGGINWLPVFSWTARGALFCLLFLSSTKPNVCIVFHDTGHSLMLSYSIHTKATWQNFSYKRTKVNPKHELRTTKLVLSKSQSQRMSMTPGRQRNSVPRLLEP